MTSGAYDVGSRVRSLRIRALSAAVTASAAMSAAPWVLIKAGLPLLGQLSLKEAEFLGLLGLLESLYKIPTEWGVVRLAGILPILD